MIGICTAEMARRAIFYSHYETIQKPMGTMAMRVNGQSIAYNRNMVVKSALENGCSHVFFLDDDVECQPDTLIKLICHNKDSITALQLRRNYPHQPLIFDEFTNKGLEAKIHFLEPGKTGLIKVAASGLGACLFKCKVFSKMEEPFFRLGEGDPEQLMEDVGFFKRLENIGLEHYCDLDAPVGHMSSTTIWPNYVDGKWLTSYDTGGYERISVFQPENPEKKKEVNEDRDSCLSSR